MLDGIAENVIPLDLDLIESLPIPEARPESRAESHNAAYIIPTSGTTGQPKLTLLEHGNYCTAASEHVTKLCMDTTLPIRVYQFAAHSFDASIIEVLTPLMMGGTICIPDEQTRLNDPAKSINEMRATWAQLTPTFVRFLEPSMIPTLATIILMGEAMSQANLDTWSQINLINGYGYENPICSTLACTDLFTDLRSAQSPPCLAPTCPPHLTQKTLATQLPATFGS